MTERLSREQRARDVLNQLVIEALAVCEPEEGDEIASCHTRAVLWKRFAAVLYPNLKLSPFAPLGKESP